MKSIIFSVSIFLIVTSLILYFWVNFEVLPLSLVSENISIDSKLYETVESKNEIAIIYIGSSTCPYCRSAVLDSTFSNLSESMMNYSTSKNINLTKIGLSGDENLAKGIEHLMNLETSFNEISTGNRWRNSTLEKYTNVPFPSSLATPQILITFRTYTDTLGSSGSNEIEMEESIGRYIGLTNIKNINYQKVYNQLNSKFKRPE